MREWEYLKQIRGLQRWAPRRLRELPPRLRRWAKDVGRADKPGFGGTNSTGYSDDIHSHREVVPGAR
jgi:hypothetical protein